LVVEIPHAGTSIPGELADSLDVSEQDVARDADLYVDELFSGAPARGAVLLAATVSRYVVDLNRFEHDVDAETVSGLPSGQTRLSRGLIWRESTEGRPVLRHRLTPADLEARLARFYRPYHNALAEQLQALHERFGYVVLLSGHSMPSAGRSTNGGSTQRRADVVPGTRGRTTAHGAIIDVVDAHFRAAGLSVRHDDPYRGGATTKRWGRPGEGLHAVQIELNRGLYMDEASRRKKPEAFRWLASLCETLVERLADLPIRPSAA
jgi:N-formylglutamate amidohydrolase